MNPPPVELPKLHSRDALLRSLGDLVRGLSALFWGLPLTLLLGARTTLSDWLRPLGILPTAIAAAILVYGLMRVSRFQHSDRTWNAITERAQILSWINLGLCPFLHWWGRLPQVTFFAQVVGILVITGLLFLLTLNQLLARLSAILPDETLKLETQFFSTLNSYLLGILMIMVAAYSLFSATQTFPLLLAVVERTRDWLALFMVLLPVALTMTMLWKIKEVILSGVFGADN